MKTIKNKKGISLIVLVITIIVMIILAAAIIISISNSGIVNRANTAVEETNEKQMKELVSLAWAEAYLKDTTETKDDAYFYDEVIAYLKGSGITDEELAKYTITADKNGADANLKTMVLNEYGFYYDQLYLGKMTMYGEEFEGGYVFHSNGAVDTYISGEFVNFVLETEGMVDENALICMTATDVEGVETEYSNKQVTIISDNGDGTPVTETITFSDDGRIASNGEVTGEIVTKNFHGIYYNRVYSGSAEIEGSQTSARISIDNNKKMTYSITTNGTTNEGTVALEKESTSGHILIFGEDMTISLSLDGKNGVFWGGIPLILTDETVNGSDTSTENEISHNGTIPEGGTYYVGVTAEDIGVYTGENVVTYTAGQSFPSTLTSGDVYVYGDYEYRYDSALFGAAGWLIGMSSFNTELPIGWSVAVLDQTKSSYGEVLTKINNASILYMDMTYRSCPSLVIAPEIPSTVISAQRLFWDCTSLTTVGDLPDGLTSMYYFCNGCTNLTQIGAVPSGVTDMEKAFYNCTSLVVAPDLSKATKLKNMTDAFNGCTSLTTVGTIPSSVTNMYGTFMYCESLTTIPDISKLVNVDDMSCTFWKCKSLTQIGAIPSNVTSIDQAFNFCTGLTAAPDLTQATKLTNMSSAFHGCTNLITIGTIPNSVTNMYGAFYNCTALETAPTIPSSVTSMGRMFYNCTALTGNVTINGDIPTSPLTSEYTECFAGTVKPIKIIGSCNSTTKSTLAGTATNGNVTY